MNNWNEERKHLPSKQKQVLDTILAWPSQACVGTVESIASDSGTGTTTVMRLVKALGYNGFTEFQEALRKEFMPKERTWWHLRTSLKKEAAERNIIQQAAEEIIHSHVTHIFSSRSSKPIAMYMEMMASTMIDNIRDWSGESDRIYDRLSTFKENDVLFAIALSPYSARTQEIVDWVFKQNGKIILLTDATESRIARNAHTLLPVPAFHDHYTIAPAIELVESLFRSIGQLNQQQADENLNHIEKILFENNETLGR